jgi:type VI secretion system protein ImpB
MSLQFKTMKDFTPEGVLQQVPELQKLMDLRNALTALKSPLGNVPGFRKKLQAMLTDPTQRDKLIAELGLNKGDGGGSEG